MRIYVEDIDRGNVGGFLNQGDESPPIQNTAA